MWCPSDVPTPSQGVPGQRRPGEDVKRRPAVTTVLRMSSYPWLPDEVALAGEEHLDPRYVAGYDRKVGDSGDPTDDLRALSELGLGARSTVVDLGAGTGRFSLAAVDHCARVVAVDISPVMVAHLRSEASRRGANNLEVVCAGFLGYSHAGAPADFVYSRHALHSLPDAWKAVALCRIADILRPGGHLFLADLVYCFEPQEMVERMTAWMSSRAAVSSDEGWTRGEIETHVRAEHSTFAWLLDEMFVRAGLDVVSFRASDYPSTYADFIGRKPHPGVDQNP